MRQFLESGPFQEDSLTQLSYTLLTGRHHFKHRLALVVKDKEMAVLSLQRTLNSESLPYQFRNVVSREFTEQKVIKQYMIELMEKSQSLVGDPIPYQEILQGLAEFYCQGYEIDWTLLFKHSAIKRIHLPTYPFARERYWVSETESRSLSAHSPRSWVKGLASPPAQKRDDIQSAFQPTDLLYSRPVWKEKALPGECPEGEIISKKDLLIVLTDSAVVAPKEMTVFKPIPSEGEGMADRFETLCLQLFEKLGEHLKEYSKRDIRLLLLSDSNEKSLIFQKGLTAFMKSVRLEKDFIKFKSLHLTGELLSQPEELHRIIGQELQTCTEPEVTVRYSGTSTKRWVESVEYLLPDSGSKQIRFFSGDLVWITGGNGKIARLTAEYLIESGLKNIVLTGRSEPSELDKESLKQLSGLNAEVSIEYVQTDVTRIDSMENIVEQVHQRNLRLKGVVHCAGSIEDAPFDHKTTDGIRNILSPKGTGVEVLDRVTRNEKMDFFILFSSITGIVGNYGQCDYAAANGFLDGFATYRQNLVQRKQRYGKTTSINWPWWKDGGMKMNESLQKMMTSQTGIAPLSRENGLDAFGTILRQNWTQVIVSEIDREFLKKTWVRQLNERGFDGHYEDNPEKPVLTEDVSVKDTILDVFSRVTHIAADKIHPDSSLTELGLDSIMTMTICRELEQHFQFRLYIAELHKISSFEKFVAFIEQEIKEQKVQNGKKTVAVTSVRCKAGPDSSGLKPLLTEIPDVSQKAGKTIFVFGTPRGGSTLLRVMLNGSRKIFAPPELYLLGYQTMKQRDDLLARQNHSFFKEGLIGAIHSLANSDTDTVKDLLARFEADEVPISAIYRYLHGYLDEGYLVDKTPGYGQNRETLQRAETDLDSPFYIYLYRHPLSVMASLVKNRFHKMLGVEGSPWEIAEHIWTSWNENIVGFLHDIPAGRQIHVPYESLVTNPEIWMRSICRKLGVEYELEMIHPYRNTEKNMLGGLHANSMMIGDPNFLNHNEIDPRLARAWEKETKRWPSLQSPTLSMAEYLGYDIEGKNLAVKRGERSESPALLPAQQGYLRRNGKDPVWHLLTETTFRSTQKPGFDRTTLQGNFSRLLNDYPSLRTAFDPMECRSNGVRKMANQAIEADQVIWLDGTTFSEERLQKEKKRLIAEMREKIDIKTGVVIGITVIELTDNRLYCAILVHHLVADGISQQIILDALFYPDRRLPVRMPQKTYLDVIDTLCTPSLLKTLEVRYKKMESYETTVLKGGKSGDANNVFKDEVEFRKEIGPSDRENSTAVAFTWETVARALYRVLAQQGKLKKVMIAHRFHRRNVLSDLDPADDIGYYAGDIPIALDSENCLNTAETGRLLLKAKSELVMGGVGYEIVANSGSVKPVGELTSVRLNFQPIPAFERNDSLLIERIDTSLFEPADHPRPYDLDCIVRQYDQGNTIFIIRYNQKQYDEKVIRSFVADWIDSISEKVGMSR